MQEISIDKPTRINVNFSAPFAGKFTVFRVSLNGEKKANYYRNFAKPVKAFNFNLMQAGIYYLPDNCKVTPTGIAKKFNLTIKTNDADRQPTAPNLNEFTFKRGLNISSPARVWKREKVIETNKQFEILPEQVQQAILFHELGHFLYASEFDCDKYAAKKIGEIGGNLSQLFYAVELACRTTEDNEKRKENLKEINKKL